MIELATRKITRITHSVGYDHLVAWSPDGKQIVFERDEAQASSIFVVNVDGSGLKRISAARFFDVGPAFSPDGRLIAFGSDRGGATSGS